MTWRLACRRSRRYHSPSETWPEAGLRRQVSETRFSASEDVSSEAAREHLRERLGLEAELKEGGAGVEVLAVGRDLPVSKLEEAHAPEADLPPRAPGDRIRHDVAERPLGGGQRRRRHHRLHRPGVIPPLPEHALEHGAEPFAARVLAEEGVAVAAVLGEAAQQGVDILAVEGPFEVVDDAHGGSLSRP